MLKSLYSGVSGMKGFQTKMDVIANNISNVNTTAFKSGRARFQDMMSQTMSNATAPSGNLGGTNPQQVGLGVQVGAIDTIMTGGSLQSTNRDLDLAIEGEGFFVVSDDGGTTKKYTRDGAFFKDNDGYLVNSNGEHVLDDSGASIQIATTVDSFSINSQGVITTVTNGVSATGSTIGLAKFSNPEGLTKVGGNNYEASDNSGTATNGKVGDPGFGVIRPSFLEMSNVDLANEFTEMIIASRAYSANSRSITTSDEMLQELINLKR